MTVAALANVDLNLLYTFDQVVRSGGVGRAAKAIGRSQPAVTARIRQLETDLGVRLFERAGRGVRLTLVGRAVHLAVSDIVVAVGGVVDAVGVASREPVGVLRIGALPTLGTHVLPEVLVDLARAYPRLRVDIEPGLTAAQLEQVRQGELDVAVSVGDIAADDLATTVVGAVRPVAVTRARARIARSRRIVPSALRDEPFVAYGDVPDPFFQHVWRFVKKHGLDARMPITVSHIPTIKSLVLAGAGVSILPDYTVVEPGLVKRPVEGLAYEHPITVTSRRSGSDLVVVRELVTRLRAKLR